MSEGAGAVGVIAAMGIVYWLAYGMAIALVAAAFAALVGIIIAVVLTGLALRWIWGAMQPGLTSDDPRWAGDVKKAPLLGGLAAVAALPIALLTVPWGWIEANDITGGPAIAIGLPFLVFFWGGAFFTITRLKRPEYQRRKWAYPGFAIYGLWIGVIAASNIAT